MKNKLKHVPDHIIQPVLPALILWVTSLFLIILQGCNNDDPFEQCACPPGPSPEITMSVLSGGEIDALFKDGADVIVFRSLDLRPVVISFSIDVPNKFYYAEFDGQRIDQVLVSTSANRKNAVISLEVWNVQNNVPLSFSVRDESLKISIFTIHPKFRIDLSPEDMVDINWGKTNLNFNNDSDISILTGTADKSIIAVYGQLLWKSSDQGLTWKNFSVDGFDKVDMIKLHPSGDLYAVSNLYIEDKARDYNSLARSQDNGNSWTILKTNLPDGSIGGMNFSPDGTFLLTLNASLQGDNIALWISENGLDWSKLPVSRSFISNGYQSWLGLGNIVVINNSIRLMEVFGGYGDEYYLLQSEDSGKTWKRINYFDFSIQGMFPSADNILPASNGNIYVTSYKGISVSKDQGLNWEEIPDGMPYDGNFYQINTLAEGAEGKIYATPKDFGVFVLEENEKRWKSVGTDLAPYNVQALASIDGRIYAAVQHQGLYVLE